MLSLFASADGGVAALVTPAPIVGVAALSRRAIETVSADVVDVSARSAVEPGRHAARKIVTIIALETNRTFVRML